MENIKTAGTIMTKRKTHRCSGTTGTLAPRQNPGRVGAKELQRLDEFIRAMKQRLFNIQQVEPGDRILDVGCGPGTDTIAMALATGKGGSVIGIDYDQTQIDHANKRAAKAGVAGWTSHIKADAAKLPFKSGYFNACRSERVFQHLSDAEKSAVEIIRVLKPGGRVVIADADWCSLSIDTPEIEIERRITSGVAKLLRNGYAGRQLYRLFKHDLTDIIIEAHPVIWTDLAIFRSTSFMVAKLDKQLVSSGLIKPREWQLFITSLEEAHRKGIFFASANIISITGIKKK